MAQEATILIVDDQLSTHEVLKTLLKEQGYNLLFAENGPQALSSAVEHIPDLILLDVMMPGMDGFEVTRRIRANSHMAEIPIIMLTALDDKGSRLRGLEVGVDDFISKPFDILELRARIRSIVRLNRYQRLLEERSFRRQAEAEVEQRNQNLTLLNHVITTAASTLNSHDILYLACESLAQTFMLAQASALLLNPQQGGYETVVEYLAPSPAVELTNGHLPQDYYLNEATHLASLMLEHLLANKIPLIITRQYSEPALSEVYALLQKYGLGLLIAIPVFMGDHLAGIIQLSAREPRHFNEPDLTLMQSIATAIGQALETAQLYQDLKHHTVRLEETITQRTQELQYQRDQTRAILDAIGEAVIVTNVDGNIRYVNPATVTLTGYTEAEMLGQNWRIWHSQKFSQTGQPTTEESLYREIAGRVRNGERWQGELNNQHKDGTLYTTLLTVAPLFNPPVGSPPVGFVGIQSNITALKEAERLRTIHQQREQQVALDRLRHTFLSTINHEMRTPLALIFQTITMLEDNQLGDLTPEQLDALTALQRQTRILGQMVEGLTRVAAFLSKQEVVRPVLAHLEPVFNSIIPLAEFKARNKQITVETDIAPNLPFFPLDVKQIEEALTQLIDNAIKFNHINGTIKISASANATQVMIAVADTGSGITAEQMGRIWEPFEQGSDSLRRAQEGLGLGLVLSRYIVEAHRGTIAIESTPNQGTTFTIMLPVSKTQKDA